VGAGTTFYVYLPASEGESAPVQGTAIEPIQGQGRILVMDDEKMVREVMGAMLKKLGYQGDFAVNGEEAVELYNSSLQGDQPFSAVIFDLTVPGGMGGKEALRQILERDTEVKAIVSSGYSDDPIMANFKEYGFKGVITKPFRITKLSEVLHDVLVKMI
jgi:CheY-like chemotaxis protein